MTTLLELVETLARDPQAKAAYQEAPDAYLARRGFGDLSPAEVNEAVLHSADALPPLVSAQFGTDGGLAAVADADPAAFDQSFTSDYEEDLFGLDPDSPIFADGELNDDLDGDLRDPLGATSDPGDQPQDPIDADVVPNDQLTHIDPNPSDVDGDAHEDPGTLHQLFDAADPHDLDAAPGPADPAVPSSQPTITTPAPANDAGFKPDVEEFGDPFGGDHLAGPDTSLTDTRLTDTGLTDTGLTDTGLFEEANPLAVPSDQPMLDDPDRAPFDTGTDQPDDDILEDVGDFDLE